MFVQKRGTFNVDEIDTWLDDFGEPREEANFIPRTVKVNSYRFTCAVLKQNNMFFGHVWNSMRLKKLRSRFAVHLFISHAQVLSVFITQKDKVLL